MTAATCPATLTAADRTRLRDLAKEVAGIAALPVMAERKRLWKRHNSLDRPRALILVFPEGSWGELLPQSVLACESEPGRRIEWELRRRIYQHHHINDDNVVGDEWPVFKAIHRTGWGLEPRRHDSTEARGAWSFEPVLNGPGDLKKMRHPEVSHDEAETERRFTFAQELFGDILDVHLKGVGGIGYHLMNQYTALRGLEEMMLDMYEAPDFLHETMTFLVEGHQKMLQQYVDQNLLSLNNDYSYHSSGGNGWTDELPAPGFDPARVRPCDIWASAEAQELAQVGPQQHVEFCLQYEKQLLDPFGLNGYGCCEDLTRKLDDVFTLPNLRRISISPWADVEACAAKLGDRYIYSWKPQPADLVGNFDTDRIRAYLRHAVEATRGCVFEMILKDTHTCDQHPERFTEWVRIAREEVDRLGA